MPRKPKPKNALSAGERVALYNAEQEEKMKRLSPVTEEASSKAEKGEEARARATVRPKSKINLKKPERATVRVDLSVKTGEIRALNGMCNGPVSYGVDVSGLFRDMGVGFVRFDGADTAISSLAVDVSKIFKDINSDPGNPENYDFSLTDKYVKAACDLGAEVIFRLGESIDLLGERDAPSLPENFDAYTRACVNIVKHYNGCFAEKFACRIKYFDILCYNPEEDASRQFELYGRIANAVKTFDEEIRVGGMSFGENVTGEFLRYCKKNSVPLDFLSLDCFAPDVEYAAERVDRCVAQMKNLGFHDTKIILGKWSYIDSESLAGKDFESVVGDKKISDEKRKLFESQGSVKGAAFASSLMIRLNSVETVLASCFYDAQPMISPWCAISDRFGAPKKPYFALKAFGELRKAKNEVLCVSEQTEGYSHTGIYAAAAVDDNGEAYILISSFKGCGTVDIRVEGISDKLYTADVYILDGVKDMSLGDSVALSGMKKRFVLNMSEYGAVMIKLY